MSTTTPAPYRYRRNKRPTQLIPIPGNDLRVGDRFWVNTTDVLTVERIGLAYGPTLRPMLVAYGTKQYGEWEPEVTCPAEEPYYGHHWVVVDR